MTQLITAGILFLALLSCQPNYKIPVELAVTEFTPYGTPTDMVIDSSKEYIYITNDYGGYIGVFEGKKQIASIKSGGERPHRLAVDEKNGWVYVVNRYSNNVTVINGTTILNSIPISGREPQGITIETKRGWAYIVSGYNAYPPFGQRGEIGGHITILEGTNIIDTIDVGPIMTTHIIADPMSGYVYVGSSGKDGGDILVIDGTTVLEQYDLEGPIIAMDVNNKTGDVYVLNCTKNRELSLFNNGKFISDIQLGTECSKRNIAVNPVNNDVYVVDFVTHEVVVINDMVVSRRVPVGEGPLKMAVDSLTGNLYVANFSSNDVTVINGDEVIATIEVELYPYGIGVNPKNGWVYVSNTNSGTVTILGYLDK